MITKSELNSSVHHEKTSAGIFNPEAEEISWTGRWEPQGYQFWTSKLKQVSTLNDKFTEWNIAAFYPYLNHSWVGYEQELEVGIPLPLGQKLNLTGFNNSFNPRYFLLQLDLPDWACWGPGWLSVYAWTDFYLHASLGNGCPLYVYLYLHVNKSICSSSAFVLLFLKGLLIPSKIRISSIWFRWQFSPHEQQEIEMNCFWNEPLLIQAVQQVLE